MLAGIVVVRDGKVIATGEDYGVRELLATVDRIGPEVGGASLADKVVGKAVALIVVYSGIRAVDTRVASEPAVRLLNLQGIPSRPAPSFRRFSIGRATARVRWRRPPCHSRNKTMGSGSR